MARAALEWSTQELATRAGVGLNTVNRFESGACQPRGVTLDALSGALEAGRRRIHRRERRRTRREAAEGPMTSAERLSPLGSGGHYVCGSTVTDMIA